jgi:hypothetical protein
VNIPRNDLKAVRLVMLALYERALAQGKPRDAEAFIRCAQLITAELR